MEGPRFFGTPGYFYEAARWHNGRWWVSDMWSFGVRSFSESGEAREELSLDNEDRPSGMGWLPDGSLLVVAMNRRAVMRLRPGASAPEIHADLMPLTGHLKGFCNDMAVAKDGTAYVGFDADFNEYGMSNKLGMILQVDADGTAKVAVADGLMMPNGMVFEGDKRLIVAETIAQHLTAFAIQANGSLVSEGVWADLAKLDDHRPDKTQPLPDRALNPDGIEIDSQGNIWVADYLSCAARVDSQGRVTGAVFLPEGLAPWACGLGGSDRHTLLLCGSDFDMKTRREAKKSKLFTTKVDIPAVS